MPGDKLSQESETIFIRPETKKRRVVVPSFLLLITTATVVVTISWVGYLVWFGTQTTLSFASNSQEKAPPIPTVETNVKLTSLLPTPTPTPSPVPRPIATSIRAKVTPTSAKISLDQDLLPPELLAPENGQTFYLKKDNQLTLIWNPQIAMNGSLWFELKITEDEGAVVIQQLLSDTKFTLSAADIAIPGEYVWQVRMAQAPHTELENYGDWTDERQFSIALPPTPTPSPTPAQTIANTIPVLFQPDNEVALSGQVTFRWQWAGPPLEANQGFELRIWQEGQPYHYGAASPTQETQIQINLSAAYGIQQGTGGQYFWTVVVVQRDPYETLGAEAAPRTFTFGSSSGGSSSGGGGTDDRGAPPP